VMNSRTKKKVFRKRSYIWTRNGSHYTNMERLSSNR